MISLRLAVPAFLVAAAVAGCFTYFVTPLPPVEGDQGFPTRPEAIRRLVEIGLKVKTPK